MTEFIVGVVLGAGLGGFGAYMLATHLGLATLQADVANIVTKIEALFKSVGASPPPPAPPAAKPK